MLPDVFPLQPDEAVFVGNVRVVFDMLRPGLSVAQADRAVLADLVGEAEIAHIHERVGDYILALVSGGHAVRLPVTKAAGFGERLAACGVKVFADKVSVVHFNSL